MEDGKYGTALSPVHASRRARRIHKYRGREVGGETRADTHRLCQWTAASGSTRPTRAHPSFSPSPSLRPVSGTSGRRCEQSRLSGAPVRRDTHRLTVPQPLQELETDRAVCLLRVPLRRRLRDPGDRRFPLRRPGDLHRQRVPHLCRSVRLSSCAIPQRKGNGWLQGAPGPAAGSVWRKKNRKNEMGRKEGMLTKRHVRPVPSSSSATTTSSAASCTTCRTTRRSTRAAWSPRLAPSPSWSRR
ncbi:hypothetical protein VTK73DRAFT_2344 [Phialemonium thermophilum]|uniref:Uncharacterized protein n=1 Tax=Phialemonium thermophilum TaxID=223376 RepID=A0ABR3VS98_9PEZI